MSKEHWDAAYESKDMDQVSWFEANPEHSLRLAARCELNVGSRVIDVGGGSSLFGAEMARLGMEVTVNDLSSAALERGKVRAGHLAENIRYVSGNVLDIQCPAQFDLWHDRAVFHFLTRDEEQQEYGRRVRSCVKVGGFVLMATFSTDGGPLKCSGLDVKRWNAAMLQDFFGDTFALVWTEEIEHRTPWGSVQRFCYALFRRNSSGKTGETPTTE